MFFKFINFCSSDRTTENTMSGLYVTKKLLVIILKKMQMTMKTFAPPFFNYFSSLSQNRENRVAVRKNKVET